MKQFLPFLLLLNVLISCKKKNSEPGPDFGSQVAGEYRATLVEMEGFKTKMPAKDTIDRISIKKINNKKASYNIELDFSGFSTREFGEADLVIDGSPIYFHPTATSDLYCKVDGDSIFIQYKSAVRGALETIKITGVKK
ncbi:hypothetical protein [Dyadobacter sp. LHD-138]|uniref:hypothetical protein n=1 Tax=Dyadobacter sp. LHD-138 TaxID=3071413 RepID=UPI0027E08F47|nr:hypothetical protein [Dyadobacter sp. LHD-138]MDQ6482218.1 hypothetical protein [Dyadobacter sp. LHD-138]